MKPEHQFHHLNDEKGGWKYTFSELAQEDKSYYECLLFKNNFYYYFTGFHGFFSFTMVNFSEVVKCIILHILSFIENDTKN